MRARATLLLLIGCGSSASGPDTVRLEEVKQEIREEFPDVPAITTEELAAWIAAPGKDATVLLDVREADEYDVSHLQGARRARTEAEALATLRDAPDDRRIVVYCSVGYRSAVLARTLRKRGYTNVFNLEGSIFQWANEGRPVYRGDRRASGVHPYDSDWGRLLDPKLRREAPETP